jgi:hypothetical protein
MRTSSRRGASAILPLVAAAIALVAVAGPTTAVTPQQVHIVAHMSKDGTGIFEATGSAVDEGLICGSGTVLDAGNELAGWQSGQKVQVLSRKALTCTDAEWIPDGSGTFFVKIQIHAVFGGDEPFTWVVQGGTGAYADVRGSGDGVTADNTPESNTNIYDGFLVQ